MSQDKRVKYFDWSEDKNDILSEERGVCFQDVVIAIENGKLLDILEHKNQAKYPNPRVLVPFVEDAEKIFLKTIIPSRKATKEYLVKKKDK